MERRWATVGRGGPSATPSNMQLAVVGLSNLVPVLFQRKIAFGMSLWLSPPCRLNASSLSPYLGSPRRFRYSCIFMRMWPWAASSQLSTSNCRGYSHPFYEDGMCFGPSLHSVHKHWRWTLCGGAVAKRLSLSRSSSFRCPDRPTSA